MPKPTLGTTVACIFDAYGTLFDVTAAARRCTDTLGDRADALAALWRSKQLEYTWLRSLMGRHADFWQVTGEALDYAMARLALQDAGLRDRLMALYRNLDAYPDARPMLMRLRHAGRRTGILSNGAPDMLASAVASAGLVDLLDPVLSVEDVGIYKPHPSVYALVQQRLALEPAQICFVSSNGWDAAGAAAFGFLTVWVNRSAAPREMLPASPTAELPGLDELPALIGC